MYSLVYGFLLIETVHIYPLKKTSWLQHFDFVYECVFCWNRMWANKLNFVQFKSCLCFSCLVFLKLLQNSFIFVFNFFFFTTQNPLFLKPYVSLLWAESHFCVIVWCCMCVFTWLSVFNSSCVSGTVPLFTALHMIKMPAATSLPLLQSNIQ